MTKIYLILFSAVVISTACQQTPEPVPVDIGAEKAALNEMFNKFNSAFNANDAETLISMLTEDFLGCGSDPSEFFTKQVVSDVWTQMFAETDAEIKILGERKIQVESDGNSAVVVDHYMFPLITPKIPWRNVYNTVKIDGEWKISFFSASFVPKDEDIPKLNAALE